MQPRCGSPSSHTVQAEQAPRLHAIFVPVSPSGPRNASTSVMRGSTRRGLSTPLTFRTMSNSDPLGALVGAARLAVAPARASRALAPTAAETDPPRTARRDILAPAMSPSSPYLERSRKRSGLAPPPLERAPRSGLV